MLVLVFHEFEKYLLKQSFKKSNCKLFKNNVCWSREVGRIRWSPAAKTSLRQLANNVRYRIVDLLYLLTAT